MYVRVVGVADDACAGIVASQDQGAFASVDADWAAAKIAELCFGHGGAAYANAGEARGADTEATCRRACGLRQGAVASRKAVGVRILTLGAIGVAVNGDVEHGCRCRAVAIGQRVGVAVDQGLTVVERVHRWVGVVQCVAVSAVAVQHQTAVR